MERLYVAVKIINLPKIVVVPIRYIYQMNLAKSLNNRINRNQTHHMFWSNEHNKEPNFDLEISRQFIPEIDSCYNVKLLKVFGEIS